MVSAGKSSKKASKAKADKKPKAEAELEKAATKAQKKTKPKTEESRETVAVTEVAEVTEPLEVVETEEIEREAPAVEEVRAEEIVQELRELKPKGATRIVVGPPRLTRFERARIVGARALQLALGAPTLVSVASGITDSISLADYELGQKALPISLRRILPNGQYQDIPVRWLLESGGN